METFTCETCHDTGKVSIAVGPDDFEEVACPDCPKGLELLENDKIDMSGADENKER